MDDKRLEFVAMMLAGEGVQHLNPEAIRKRVREASAAYDVMMEELGGGVKSGYPWHKAPEWAKWAATDQSGKRWWFSHKPTTIGSIWDKQKFEHQADLIDRLDEYCLDWLDSLEARQ